MSTPTPQFKVPQLQREAASLESPKPERHSARNLLRGVFKKGWEPPPTAPTLQNQHTKALLETPIGRDFALITAAGVEFKVHSIMLIGGSKMLQEGLFPDGVPHPNPPTLVNLPPHFHPILVDRVVNFIYTSYYEFDPTNKSNELKPENFHFHNATFIPTVDSPTPAMTALAGIRNHSFHLRIYALGEELDYSALKSAAHAKLVDLFITRRGRLPYALKDIVDATFSSPGSAARICKDEDGALQQFAAAAVLAHELKDWQDKHIQDFTDSVQGPEYADFWNVYNAVKEDNQDLVKLGDMARLVAEERKKGKSVGEDKTKGIGADGSPMKAPGNKTGNRLRVKKQKKQERRRVGLLAKADGDGDLDMEVD